MFLRSTPNSALVVLSVYPDSFEGWWKQTVLK